VLCVTHLAQVAAQAHSQFRVLKQTDGRVTRTAVNTLGAAERVAEIARMLGGIDITDQALAHAREMLKGGRAIGHDTAARTPAVTATAGVSPGAGAGAARKGPKTPGARGT
jgi:hypothetical protein